MIKFFQYILILCCMLRMRCISIKEQNRQMKVVRIMISIYIACRVCCKQLAWQLFRFKNTLNKWTRNFFRPNHTKNCKKLKNNKMRIINLKLKIKVNLIQTSLTSHLLMKACHSNKCKQLKICYNNMHL